MSGPMDQRKAAILRAVVDEYVQSAEPVGSSYLARVSGIQVSSATIRNDMNLLEHEGYLTQPHTSAGRIPTDKGYRYYVDTFASEVDDSDVLQFKSVEEFFTKAHGALAEMFSDTSRLLTNMTNYAAVVTGPSPETILIRSVQLVSLDSRRVLLLMVDSKGAVEKKVMELANEISEADLEKVSNMLTRKLRGFPLGSLCEPESTGSPDLDQLCTLTVESLKEFQGESEAVYIEGASKVANAFDAVDTVRRVLATLEQHFLVVSLIRDVLSKGQKVAIGSELGIEPLAECSVVVSPYVVEGEQLGSIGLVGPTRMNYPKVLAAVNLVSTGLGKRLSEG
ncbi:MAG: heat-inducible transcription repressor HrcA [Actinomycetota bacterium]|nr:MAG: heat-inducible transcription repressor HrcA [Actinomycetota bacterium]